MTIFLRPALFIALAGGLAATPLRGQSPDALTLDTVNVAAVSRVSPTVVSAQRSVEVVSRETIGRRAARSVTDLLAMTVGADVQTRSPAQADLALRGSSLGQVLVLVDGVRVSDLQTAHFDLDLAVPLDAVERIEILRGPGVTLYGSDAVGGVVNIVTRRDASWQQARVHHGSFGTTGGGVAAGRVLGVASVHGSLDAERSSGHRDGTDYDVLQARVGAGRSFGASHVAGDIGVASRDFGAADFYAPAPSYERTRTQTASMRFTSAVKVWDLSATASVRRHTDDFILRRADPAFYRNQHTTLQRTLELGARRALGNIAGLAVGAEGFDAELQSVRLGNRREQRGAAFAEATLGGAQTANASVGARVDRSTSLGTFVSPSASASVPLHERFRLRASAGRGLRGPSWTERYYSDPANIANPDITAEHFWAGEIGARATPRWGSADIAVFVREAADVIDWVKPAGAAPTEPWRTANLASVTYRGVEVIVAADVAGTDLTLGATGIDFDASRAEGFSGKYALRPLTRVAFATVSRELLPGFRVTLDARHATRVGEARYLHANARATLQVRRVRLDADVTNIGGADYLDASARPVAGPGLIVGLRL